MTPHTPSTAPAAPAEGAVADTAQRALVDLVATIAALLPPGMLQALAAAAANVVAETQRLNARAAEAAAVCERERVDEITALRAAKRAAETVRDSERAARLAAEDAARVLRSRNAILRGAVADIGARAELLLAEDAETPEAAQAQADGDDADASVSPSAADRRDPANDRKPVCRRDPHSGAAAVDGRRDRDVDRAPRPEATAPQ